MIAPKPLYLELTQPLYRDLPGQSGSQEDVEQREPLTRELTRSLLPQLEWVERDAEND